MRLHRSFGHTAGVSIFRFALALSLSAAGASAAYGGTAYEPFDYAPGTPKTNWSGGSGFINKWQADGGSIVAGSLTDPTGTLATSGNHAEGSGNAYFARQVTFPGTGKWLSFLLSRDYSDTDPVPGPTWTGLLVDTYYIGEPASGPGNGQIVFGAGGDAGNAVTGVPLTPNVPVFLVAYFGFEEGNNYATLFVNPTPGVPPTGGTRFDGGPSLHLPGRLLTTSALVPAGRHFSLDEVRTGDTYFDVAPVVPEPAAALLIGATTSTLLARRRRQASRLRTP